MATILTNKKPKVGVIGAGSFGSTIANLAAKKAHEVLVYARSDERIENFNVRKENNGYPISENVHATNDMSQLTSNCEVLMALLPSSSFRQVMREHHHLFRPYHIIIHGTKGVDIDLNPGQTLSEVELLDREQIHTMSEVITQETCVRRVGCLAGPNLSAEIQMEQPAGAIVASKYEEVFYAGRQYLNTDRFKIFNSSDITGAEFAGVLKNIYAISSGIISGLGFGNNARALLITKGMHEMLYIGKSLGADTSAFLGIAGIGDMIATCSSSLSRNFSVGVNLAQGKSLQEIIDSMNEVAEGVRSVQIFHAYCKKNKIVAPFTESLYRVLFEGKSPEQAVNDLMAFRYNSDVDFL